MRGYLLLLSFSLLTLLAGCSGPAPAPPQADSVETPSQADEEAEVRASLKKLSPEDRKLAEAQKFCAVETKSRLGAMGKPFAVTVKGQTVFLCCKGCQKKALADPDKTLALVEALKAGGKP